MRRVSIYTDGSYSERTGKGGWGAVVIFRKGTVHNMKGGCCDDTGILRMELTAILEALRWLDSSCNVIVYTDSLHIQQCMTQRLARWKATGWQTVFGAAIKNRDLWEELDFLCHNVHVVTWNWVRGHNGNLYNERADRLARKGRRNIEKKLKRRN